MMFSTIQNGSQNQQNVDFQKHCILVAASNPHPLPHQSTDHKCKTWSRVKILMHKPKAICMMLRLLLNHFALCFVSMSVIYPKQLPKLRAIYNAGKRNPQAADPPIDNVKNPHFLVLISENFIEARATLRCPGSTTLSLNPKALDALVTGPRTARITVAARKKPNKKKSLTGLPAQSRRPFHNSTDPPPTSMPSAGSSSGTGSMIPTPGIPQQAQSGIQTLGANSSSVSNPLSQQTSSALQSAQSKYVKVWEGYRSASASEMLAANWPPTLEIVWLISQDYINNKPFVKLADFLVFQAMDQHEHLSQMQEQKLLAVIKLPSQSLLLSVSDKDCQLNGMLLPWDMVMLRPGQQLMPPQLTTTAASASTNAATATAATSAITAPATTTTTTAPATTATTTRA